MCLRVQAKAQAATKGTNLVELESERVKEVVPKAGSIELLGHEDHLAAAASPGVAPSAFRVSRGGQPALSCMQEHLKDRVI